MTEDTHIITVADREGDIFELFFLERPHNMDLLIRAAQDRRVQVDDSDIGKLWNSIESVPVANQTMTIRSCAQTSNARTECYSSSAMENDLHSPSRK